MKNLIFTAFCFTIATVHLQGQTQLDKKFDFGRSEFANALIQTTDGGYLLVGAINEIGGTNFNVLVIKTDAQGDTLWTKEIQNNQSEEAFSVIQTSDSGYLIGAVLRQPGLLAPFETNWWIIKLNSIGDTLWTRSTGTIRNDRLAKVAEESNGNFIATGYMSIGDLAIATYVRLSPTGQILKTKNFNSQTSLIKDIDLDDLGNLRFTGSSFQGTHDCMIYDFNGQDSLLGTKSFGVGNFADYGTSITPMPAGGFALTGISGLLTGYYPMVYRLNADLDTIWSRRLTQFETNYFTQEVGLKSDVNSQNEIFAAFTGIDNGNDYQGIIFRMSPDGAVTFKRGFGDVENDYLRDILVNSEQQPVVCGYHQSPGNTNFDAWLLIPDLNFTNIQSKKGPESLDLFPNPAQDYLYIRGIHSNYQISIFNSLGKIWNEFQMNMDGQVSVSGLFPGVYTVEINGPEIRKSVKFIKTR